MMSENQQFDTGRDTRSLLTPLGCLFISISVRHGRPLAAHSDEVLFSSEFEKAFFRGEPESGVCRRWGSSSEGEFRARLQWRMNETIDLSLCGETAHEYRALTGETGRDGNQDEKRGASLRDCTGGWRSGGGGGGVGEGEELR